MRIGILALQGGVYEHHYMLRRAMEELGLTGELILVKRPQHLRGLDAIVIPGGESTTIGRLASRLGILEPLRDALREGLPALGTCAGAVMLAKSVRDARVGETGQPILGVMDVEVVRNYYGRQRESFELDLHIEGIEGGPYRGVFIRAPAITRLWGGAKAIAWAPGVGEDDKVAAAAVEGGLLATVFHPELTGDTRIHKLFLETVKR